jgi:protein transport protein SEC24
MAVDTGNCSPRLLRCTLCAPPGNRDLLNSCGIPFALIATPFADPADGEEPVPVVDLGQAPPRCTRCNGYMNSAVRWVKDGNAWDCNLCSMTNETPSWYFNSLDGSGQRLDKASRPELSRGAVDYAVPADYCSRPEQEPIYVFAIDISLSAVNSGFTSASIRAVQQCLQSLPGGSLARAGIVTFHMHVHFYQVREDSPEPVRVMLADADDPWAAIPPSHWILPVQSQISALELLLKRIPELIPKLHSEQEHFPASPPGSPRRGGGSTFSNPFYKSCPLAAVKAVQTALENLGGRIFLMTSNNPTLGYGKLKQREKMQMYGMDSELALYGSPDVVSSMYKEESEKDIIATYTNLAQQCSESHVVLNVLFGVESFEQDFKDVGLLSTPCEGTGGAFYAVTGSMAHEQTVQGLYQQLHKAIRSTRAWEAIMKVRTSVGVQVQSMLGRGFFRRIEEELEVSGIDSHSTYLCKLRCDGNLRDNELVHVQLAVLYTNSRRQRLVRVLNLGMFSTQSHTSVFRYSDLDAVVTCITKEAVHNAMRYSINNPKDIGNPRNRVYEQLVDILYKYRMKCSSSSPRGQLILPESLKLLPLYSLAVMKHPALVEAQPTTPNGTIAASRAAQRGPTIRGHERAFELRRLQSLPVKDTINALYPRLIGLHTVIGDDQLRSRVDSRRTSSSDDLDNEKLSQYAMQAAALRIPRSMPVTAEVLRSDGIYLLDDGAYMFLYIGRNIPFESIEDWFGIEAYALQNGERPARISFNQQNAAADKIFMVVQALRDMSPFEQELKVIWADDTSNSDEFMRFALRLMEDSTRGTISYVDYLCKLHGKIQAKN